MMGSPDPGPGSSTNQEPSKRTGFESILRRFERSTDRNRDGTDFELSAWLDGHPEVSSPIGPLLKYSFWKSGAILAQRNDTSQLEFLNFLLNNESNLRESLDEEDAGKIVSILFNVKWASIESRLIDKLFCLLAGWPKTSAKHLMCIQLAQQFVQKCPSSSAVLFLVSSAYLLSKQGLGLGFPLLPSCSFGGSSNWSLFTDESGKLLLVGLFGNPQRPKVVEAGELSLKRPSEDAKQGEEKKRPPPPPIKSFRLPDGKPYLVSCGMLHGLIFSTNRLLYSFGQNVYGQCGTGDTVNQETPIKIVGNWSEAISISAGQYHSGMVLADGSVYTWGWGMYGQLGLGERRGGTDALSPTKRIPHAPKHKCLQMGVPDLPEPMKSISCGRAHTILLGDSGTVYASGCGIFGQLGTLVDIKKRFSFRPVDLTPGSPSPKIQVVATKFYHTVAMAENGDLFEWGKNPHDLKMKMFVMKRLRNAQAAKGDHGVKTPDYPKDFLGVFKVKHEITEEVVHITTGLSHSALLTRSGEIYTWGKSLDHQLGHGSKLERTEPLKLASSTPWANVQCGGHYTLGLSTDGDLYSWGRNDFGQCGVISEKIPQSPRKFIFKAKGDVKKCVHLPDESSYVARPQVIPSIRTEILTRKETIEERLRPDEVLERIRTADLRALRAASSILDARYSKLASLPGSFVHLLGGNLRSSVTVLGKVIEERGGFRPEDHDVQHMTGVLWEAILSGDPSDSLLEHSLLRLPLPQHEATLDKLRLVWPAAWYNEKAQAGLGHIEKAKILQKWVPGPTFPTNVHILSSSLPAAKNNQKMRVWAACGHSEPATTENAHCGECMREWLELIRGGSVDPDPNSCPA